MVDAGTIGERGAPGSWTVEVRTASPVPAYRRGRRPAGRSPAVVREGRLSGCVVGRGRAPARRNRHRGEAPWLGDVAVDGRDTVPFRGVQALPPGPPGPSLA